MLSFFVVFGPIWFVLGVMAFYITFTLANAHFSNPNREQIKAEKERNRERIKQQVYQEQIQKRNRQEQYWKQQEIDRLKKQQNRREWLETTEGKLYKDRVIMISFIIGSLFLFGILLYYFVK